MNTVRVTQLIKAWDMRATHALRDGRAAQGLKAGEAVVAFNRKLTMARIIDCLGGVHTYYADDKEVFDLNRISELMQGGFFVSLRISKRVPKSARILKAA